MLDPKRAFGFGIAELDGVNGIGALGYQALVEVGTPFSVDAP